MSEKEKVDKAIKLYNDGKYQEAIDAFSSVLEVCQDNAELYNNIALCYANLGEYEKAEKYYLKAIKSGDLILLKASNSMNFSKILNEIKA